jgi:hypothetical protein
MDTNEYFAELEGFARDNINPEFHTYATTYLRARSPQMFSELLSKWRQIEGEIYARNECSGEPF